MYRHLLVPLDDSALSTEIVNQAVALARALGARVTFFHAQADFGGSSVGALERVMAPAAFNEDVRGEARALLAKAEVVARAVGVAHDSFAVTSDRPYEAILAAAAARGCDLVFMASHGRRGIKGLMLGSETQKVLQHATIPVLVAAVESNRPVSEADAALNVIRDEHRSLAAVLHGLEFVVREARASGTPPSLPLLRAMIHYIRAFPETLHHPKEELYLFRKLSARTSEFDETLTELARQHEAGAPMIDALDAAIAACGRDFAQGLPALAAATERFVRAQMDHMALETKVILPAARAHLALEDWKAMAAAFGENGDPRFSVDADEEYRSLFTRILNLAPEGVVPGVRIA